MFAGPFVNHQAILELHSDSSCFAWGRASFSKALSHPQWTLDFGPSPSLLTSHISERNTERHTEQEIL